MGQAASDHTLTKTEIAAPPRRELSEDSSSTAKLGALPRSDLLFEPKPFQFQSVLDNRRKIHWALRVINFS